MYRDASHLWRSFSHNRTKINIQFLIDNWKCRIIAFPLHPSTWNFIQRLPMSDRVEYVLVSYLIRGQKVKRQGHNALITENSLYRIIAFPLHLSPWNFIQRLPNSRVCFLLISGSKGQRSTAQCIDNWKWFMLHNFFPFTPIIMKIYTKNPHEPRICMPYWFLGQKSRSQCIDVWKWFVLHYFFPFTTYCHHETL